MKLWVCVTFLLLGLTLLPFSTSDSNAGETTTTPSPTTAILTPSTQKISATNPDSSTNTTSTEAATNDSSTGQTTASREGDNNPPVTDGSASTGTPPNTTTLASDTTQPPNTTPPPNTTHVADTTQPPTTTLPPTTTQTTMPTSSPAGPTTSTSSPASSFVISETNLLLATHDFFVEFKGDSNATANLTLVIFNANTTEVAYNGTVELGSSTGHHVHPIDNSFVESLESVLVALYPPESYTGLYTASGLQDFAVVSRSPEAIAQNIKEGLLQMGAATIVKKGLTPDSGLPVLSLSRCGLTPRDNSVFLVTPQSRGQSNSCSQMSSTLTLTLQLSLKDDNCKASVDDTDALKAKLQRRLIDEVTRRCGCGLSTLQIQSNLTCARDLYMDFNIHQTFTGQEKDFTTAFKSYVNGTHDPWTFGSDKLYSLVNCWQECRKPGAHHPTGNNNKDGNITVTVAVVLSCVAVFLLILISVVIYMRRKRQGIMRQFRMTRLQEDDDMDDMDDFIGGGLEQEPSFNSSRSNLTS